MRLVVSLLAWFLRAVFASRRSLALEDLALRQQLATYTRAQKRPRLRPVERAFWVALSKAWQDWRTPLVFVKPATVIDWHRRGFRRYWRWRSRKPGRPRIPAEHIALIRRISSDQPGWGENRIADVPAALDRDGIADAHCRPLSAAHAPRAQPDGPGSGTGHQAWHPPLDQHDPALLGPTTRAEGRSDLENLRQEPREPDLCV